MAIPTEAPSDLDSAGSKRTHTGDYTVLWGLLLGTFVVLINDALAALASLATVGRDTAVLQVLLGRHVLLMASLATLFTPVFTLALASLASLPSRLHSHGSSLLGTMQQVAAAVGTAIVVTVMSWRSAALVEGGSGAIESLVGGIRAGFGAATAVVLLALVMLLPNRPTAGAVDTDPELESGR